MALRLTEPPQHVSPDPVTPGAEPLPFSFGWASLGAGVALAEPLCGKGRDGTDDEADDDDEDFEGFDDDEADDDEDDEDEFDDEEDDLSEDDEDGDGTDEEEDDEEDEPL